MRIPLMSVRRATLPNRAKLRHAAPPLKGGVLLQSRPGMQSAITARAVRRCRAQRRKTASASARLGRLVLNLQEPFFCPFASRTSPQLESWFSGGICARHGDARLKCGTARLWRNLRVRWDPGGIRAGMIEHRSFPRCDGWVVRRLSRRAARSA